MFGFTIFLVFVSTWMVGYAQYKHPGAPEWDHNVTTTALPPHIKNILKNTNYSDVNYILNTSRRILIGSESYDRPYMVYLKLPVNNPKYKEYRGWLCGGVIVHEEYILTSAACIEDVKHFYIVAGLYKHDSRDDRHNCPCIKNGAKKAVWKCIPRNYVFDGHENDNIRWMNNDIAVVKVEEEFDFNRKIRGCDFVPKPICYNNQSVRLEEPGQFASVAGWGSVDKYNVDGSSDHHLLEASVSLIPKIKCKKRWGKRYHNIIDNYMICSQDLTQELSEICQEKYVDCVEVDDSSDSGEGERRVLTPINMQMHSAYDHFRRAAIMSGGFCENDHGGPLVHGTGANSIVIGIISACLVKERTNKCYGPFLYTSVFKNRNLISCAIYKDAQNDNCNKLFRSSITHTEEVFSWKDHPDGPAKNEVSESRRAEENATTTDSTSGSTSKPETKSGPIESVPLAGEPTTLRPNVSAGQTPKPVDTSFQHSGIILRASLREPDDENQTRHDSNVTTTSVDK